MYKVIDEALNFESKEVIMCCLLRSITYLGGGGAGCV
jgi:hypothetical protein